MVQSIKQRIKAALRWVTDPEHRQRRLEVKRLQELPRYVSGKTNLIGASTQYVDAASFLSAYKAIFREKIYAFDAETSVPRIIDGGANIGLATIYWKRHFPKAEIIAFEPDPDIFNVLKKNIASHEYDKVSLVQKGLWSREGTLEFKSDGADAGHIAEVSGGNAVTKKIDVTRLVPYLDERVDLLKLDIEGGEVEVLNDAAGHLDTVQNIFVEYHSYLEQEQRLDELLRVLRQGGFRIHIQPELVASQPFIERKESFGMDHRLNIFAYRT